MSKVSEPKYTEIFKQDNIEMREYPSLIVAQVTAIGERKIAISSGFRVLADYIFGNNEPHKKISMTAPVEQQENEKIAMTAPVIQQESQKDQEWLVSFVMPAEYTLETLPAPKNTEIKILSIPVKRYLTIQFSGTPTDQSLKSHLDILLEYSVSKKLNTRGKPIFAFYNPPWTLPFLRRNEIMIELIED